MGMVGILCALSAKRRALLEEDPELLAEVIAARRTERVPGLLDLGKTWQALDAILGEGDDPILGDAILARSGTAFGPVMSFGRPKLIENERVRAVADALEALPDELVEDRYPLLAGMGVHGGYGPKLAPPPAPSEYGAELAALGLDDEEDAEEAAERDELAVNLERVTTFYRAAADRGDAVIAVVV